MKKYIAIANINDGKKQEVWGKVFEAENDTEAQKMEIVFANDFAADYSNEATIRVSSQYIASTYLDRRQATTDEWFMFDEQNHDMINLDEAKVMAGDKTLFRLRNVDMGDGVIDYYVWAKNTPSHDEIVEFVLRTDYGYDAKNLILNPDDKKFYEQAENGEILFALDFADGCEVDMIYADEL